MTCCRLGQFLIGSDHFQGVPWVNAGAVAWGFQHHFSLMPPHGVRLTVLPFKTGRGELGFFLSRLCEGWD